MLELKLVLRKLSSNTVIFVLKLESNSAQNKSHKEAMSEEQGHRVY
jgi:hypothetical protein